MSKLQDILDSNKLWVKSMHKTDPEFFAELAKGQSPRYLWIGCSDSRVPANQICGLAPGDMFVHRNIANMVIHTDINALSVIQFAVDALNVKDVIICGHYGCGGIKTAFEGTSLGVIDNWLLNIKEVIQKAKNELSDLDKGSDAQLNRACELNVSQQVYNLSHSNIVQKAWSRGQELNIHGLIYDINDGHLKDLGLCISSTEQIAETFKLNL